MDIRFYGNQRLENPSSGTCDEYGISDVRSFDDLLQAHRTLALDHPGYTPLLSLDDLAQARYTSGHARLDQNLDEATAADIALLPAECFEHGEYRGYLSSKAEFPLCLGNLRQRVAGASFADACAHGLTLDDDALQEWAAYQQAPLTLLDQPLIALLAPVAHSAEALAAFPNGYFEGDLGIAQNYAVAQHFAAAYGYALFGMGAAYLGLLRATPADSRVSSTVAEDLCALYNVAAERREAVASVVVQAVSGQRHLWLRYTE